MTGDYEVIVVGGGFYGCVLALHLSRVARRRVLLVEADDNLMHKASHSNQARVHNGYHYPRSLVTAARSRANYDLFCRQYADCVDDSYAMYYAIARRFSQVDAAQFELFCRRIDAPLEPAPAEVTALFDSTLIERVFRVQEAVFNANALRTRLRHELEQAGVHLRTSCRATCVTALGHALCVDLVTVQAKEQVRAQQVFNCTYASLNQFAASRSDRRVALKHEWTELCLMQVPDEIARIGVTVMCGPFFSFLPFPAANLHTLSHVRYTPHGWWLEGESGTQTDPLALESKFRRESKFVHMLADARRYMPVLASCEHRGSMWGVKTVLPRNEVDDGRPILFRSDPGLPGLHDVMGAKVDNVYDVLAYVDRALAA